MVDAIIKSHKTDPVLAPAAVSAPVNAPAAVPAAPTTVAKPIAPEALRVQTPPDVKEAILASSASKAAAPLKDAFSSKSLISNIVSNYNNALKAGNNAVHGPGGSATAAAPNPASPAHAAAQPVVLRDITPSSSALTAAPVKVVAAPVPAPVEQACQGYQIEDRYSTPAFLWLVRPFSYDLANVYLPGYTGSRLMIPALTVMKKMRLPARKRRKVCRTGPEDPTSRQRWSVSMACTAGYVHAVCMLRSYYGYHTEHPVLLVDGVV
jgi:hypothetical protein